jgi:hypothetical protein
MIEIKGKFITLAASLMGIYKDAVEKVDQQLFRETGKHWNELDPESWYNVKHYSNFMTAYKNASPTGENALITLGKQVYPTIKKTVGFPPVLKTPVDYLEFENLGYLENLRGPEIQPRKFVQKKEGHVIIRTKMIEQDCKILEGVYMGVMKMAGVRRGKIYQQKCIKKGDPYCEYHILWKPKKH